MNEEMANVEVLAVEVKQFERADGQGNKAIVPRVVGLTESARVAKGSRKRKLSDKKYFDAVENSLDEAVIQVIRDLYEWSQRTADRAWFGTGISTGSFTFHFRRDGKTISFLTVYTTRVVYLR